MSILEINFERLTNINTLYNFIFGFDLAISRKTNSKKEINLFKNT
jgi:2-oxo-4-hydroxy-4-carboxy--5-ureidoimidazoline (OHCU) decarboxylase